MQDWKHTYRDWSDGFGAVEVLSARIFDCHFAKTEEPTTDPTSPTVSPTYEPTSPSNAPTAHQDKCVIYWLEMYLWVAN